MEKLSDKHAEMFGHCMMNTGFIVLKDGVDIREVARVVEGIYQFIQREEERDAREAVNRQQSSGD